MKAAVLTVLNSPLKLLRLHRRDLGIGQVLVKVKCAGICGTQIGEITGAKGPDNYLPHMLGHEGGGVVVDTGPGVKTVSPGDHVVMHWRKGRGIDSDPARYDSEVGPIGSGPIATFADHAVVSENRITKIGDDIFFDIAALMGCAVTTGLGLINNEAKLKFGQSIAVAGVGGVGLNVIQGAALAGASRIIAIDIEDSKLVQAEQFGANAMFKNRGVIAHEIKKNGGQVDVFVDCTGIPSVIDDGLTLVAPGGKLILVGQPSVGSNIVIENARQHYCGKTIIDSQGGLTDPSKDIPRYLDLYRLGKLKLGNNLVTHRFPLDDIDDAIETVRSGKAGRVMLEMN